MKIKMFDRAVELLERTRASVNRRFAHLHKRIIVYLFTKHIYGSRKITLQHSECGMVILTKNAEYYIRMNFTHHFALGVRHILLIDNGSTDRTIEIAKSFDNVSIAQNSLPVNLFECYLRRELARRYFDGGWFMFVDADEMFEIPTRKENPLTVLINYCNQFKFTAVVCQVLDMVSNLPLIDTRFLEFDKALNKFQFYSTEYIERYPYFSKKIDFSWFLARNICDYDIEIFFGGIRRENFGESCCLTTHRIVKNCRDIDLYVHPHCSTNVVCADTTALIRHYKFCGHYVLRERTQIQEKVWDHGEDILRMEKIDDTDNFIISSKKLRILHSIDDLVSCNFISRSERFLEWGSSQ